MEGGAGDRDGFIDPEIFLHPDDLIDSLEVSDLVVCEPFEDAPTDVEPSGAMGEVPNLVPPPPQQIRREFPQDRERSPKPRPRRRSVVTKVSPDTTSSTPTSRYTCRHQQKVREQEFGDCQYSIKLNRPILIDFFLQITQTTSSHLLTKNLVRLIICQSLYLTLKSKFDRFLISAHR